MIVDKHRVKDALLRRSEFKLFDLDGRDYLYLADRMQIFDLQDPRVREFCRISNQHRRRVRTSLTRRQLAEIRAFVDEQADRAVQPRFSRVPRDLKSTLIMNVAKDCNLSCRYCFAYDDRLPAQKRMSFAQAREAVDFMVAAGADHQVFSLTFFGGEPLLNFSVILRLVEYCEEEYVRKQGKRFHYSITTNGTILSEAMLRLLKERRFGIIVSLDGPRHIHDRNRHYADGRSCHGRVHRNARRMREAGINFMLRATVAADCPDIMDIVRYMEDMGVPYGLEFVQKTAHKDDSDTVFRRDALGGLRRQYRRLMDHQYARIARGEKVRCVNVLTALRVIHFQTAKEIPCCAGLTAMTINPDGSLFSCQNVTNFQEISIGSPRDGLDREMMERTAARSVYDLPGCRTCWARLLCGGACLAEKYVDHADFVTPVKETCAIRKLQWVNHLRLYQRIRNHRPEFVESLVPLPVA